MDDHREIVTARLRLSPLKLEHAANLHAVFSDAETMRYWHRPRSQRAEETRAIVEELRTGPSRAWVLKPRDGGEAMGVVYYLGNPGVPGLGYILHRAHWRQGLMSEAVRGAVAYGFEQMGLDRVELWIDARNVASLGVARCTGFHRRGAFRQKYAHDDASHEKWVYGLKVEEWRGAAERPSTRPTEAYSLQPIVSVLDVRGTAEFYRDRLGFEIGFLYGEPPTYGAVSLSDWTATGAHIHFAQTEHEPPAGSLALFVNVGPEIDQLRALYISRGVEVLGPVVHQPWGLREFSVRDCNGIVLRFATPG